MTHGDTYVGQALRCCEDRGHHIALGLVLEVPIDRFLHHGAEQIHDIPTRDDGPVFFLGGENESLSQLL